MTKKELLTMAVYYAIIVVVLTFPAIFYLGDRIIGDGGDSLQFMGYQYIAKEEFMKGNFPFGWTNYWRYPYGVEIPNIVDSSLFVITGLLLYQFFSDSILVYNLSALFLFFLNVFVTYVAFRIIFKPLPSFVGSIMYGLSFYSLARLGGHVSLMVIAGFPLFVSGLVHMYQTAGSSRSFVLVTLATLLIAFSSPQYPLLLIGVLPFTALVLFLTLRKEFLHFFHVMWAKKIHIAVSLFSVVAIFSLFHGQKLIDLVNGEVPMPVYTISSIPFVNFFIPNGYVHTVVSIFSNDTNVWIENVTFPGYVEIIVFFAFLPFVKRDQITAFLLTAGVITYIIALGVQDVLQPIWPYQYLFDFFPFRGIIEPGRFIVISYLWFCVLIIRSLQHSYPQKRTLIIGIIVALFIERIPVDFQMSPNLYEGGFILKVQDTPTKAVMDLPIQTDWWNGQIYDLYSIYYEKPIVNGYFNWSGNSPEAKTLTTMLEPYTCYPYAEHAPQDFSEGASRLLKDDVLRRLRFYSINTIVVHKDLLYPDGRCARARKNIEVLLEDTDRFILVYENAQKKVLFIPQ